MLFDRFNQFAVDEGLDLTGRVLLGISGGVDSVVLAHLTKRTAAEIVCLHVNYGLRGSESDEDEKFVRGFCARSALDLVVADVREEMQSPGGTSMQALARKIRYREFVREAHARGIRTVLLAHHADDQVETVLMNLFRGSGLHGLAGMPVVRPAGKGLVDIARPLLFARRSDIEAYATEHGLPWREDTSNTDKRYRRSILRHEILPLIERHFGPATAENILRSSTLARRLAGERHEGLQGSSRSEEDRRTLSISELQSLPEVMRTGRILDMLALNLPDAPRSFAVSRQIEKLISSQPGRRVQFEGAAVIRERDVLLFVEDENGSSMQEDYSIRLLLGGSVRIPGGTLFAHRLESPPVELDAGTPFLVFVDADTLGDELSVTTWRSGDRISLLGGEGTKKVSDLLTDAKTPVVDRRNVPVVRAAGKIAWVVGVRMSAEFRVRPSTAAVAMLGFIPQAHD